MCTLGNYLLASYFEPTLHVRHGYNTPNEVSILHKLYVCDFVSVYKGEILRYVYFVFNALKQQNGICYLCFSCCWLGLFKLLMMLVSFVAVLVDDASLLCCWFWSPSFGKFGFRFWSSCYCLFAVWRFCSVFLVPCDWVCS